MLDRAATPGQAAQADNMLTGRSARLFAVAEAYPDLKANTNFLELQRELTDTEDKIAYSRQFYNGNVREYNEKIAVVPSSIIAGMFNFEPAEFYEAEEGAREDVTVSFGRRHRRRARMNSRFTIHDSRFVDVSRGRG